MFRIEKIFVPLCLIAEQKTIVEQIENSLQFVLELEERIAEVKNELRTLRRTLLARAFRGELLTEAELVELQAEADYAPAGVLLERIREEKAREAGSKRKKSAAR